MEHDWHLFDVERGYEARMLGPDEYEIRDPRGTVTRLNAEAFEQLRAEGPNPEGLE